MFLFFIYGGCVCRLFLRFICLYPRKLCRGCTFTLRRNERFNRAIRVVACDSGRQAAQIRFRPRQRFQTAAYYLLRQRQCPAFCIGKELLPYPDGQRTQLAASEQTRPVCTQRLHGVRRAHQPRRTARAWLFLRWRRYYLHRFVGWECWLFFSFVFLGCPLPGWGIREAGGRSSASGFLLRFGPVFTTTVFRRETVMSAPASLAGTDVSADGALRFRLRRGRVLSSFTGRLL
ncbi:hypothetical protein CKS_5413 [Pantoea stewartii subsp. stewartii DC283]|uniref:Uncharacterized protein n=1 Tax=Pantoea stewartii subsp. stewartii DC283 TaxID=660596 RepID=H3RL90_PANSE|nr:hypothetical protein CKS_5413 [Pantoea stewartii subsp. stewartii DC283]